MSSDTYYVNDALISKYIQYRDAYNTCLEKNSDDSCATILEASFAGLIDNAKHVNDSAIAAANKDPKSNLQDVQSITLDGQTKSYNLADPSDNLIGGKNSNFVRTHSANASTRTNMDKQLYNLHHNPYLADSQLQVDTTVYASLCWIIVATSLLYIVFVEM